jgi:chemotaxis methyl-accepting protein methylase
MPVIEASTAARVDHGLEHELEELLAAAALAYGLSPRGDWLEQARRALEDLAARRRVGVPALLADGPAREALLRDLMPALTVAETFFLRNATQFAAAADNLAARLFRDPTATAVIWSAGCASGEEPYSIAIALCERVGPEGLGRVRILGTDASSAALAKAREGVYGAWSFREAPPWLLPRYFRSCPGGCRLEPVIREAVAFEEGDLLRRAETTADASVDIIFFRNVGIYLRPGPLAAVYTQLRRILAPDGLLCVAPGDPRPSAALFTPTDHESTSVYRAAVSGGVATSSARASGARGAQHARSVAERAAGKARPATRARKTGAGHATPARVPAPPRPRADTRDAEAGMSVASALIDAAPSSAQAYLVRGELAMAAGRFEDAVADLRRALFLDPRHRLARYWYALALQSHGDVAQCLAQARVLAQQLDEGGPDARLEDDETRAAELLDAVRLLQEGLA